jgi:hypothetical protein
MPRRLGRVRHELMQTMAEMRAHLLVTDEKQQLSTTDAKTLREYVRQRERHMQAASDSFGSLLIELSEFVRNRSEK